MVDSCNLIADSIKFMVDKNFHLALNSYRVRVLANSVVNEISHSLCNAQSVYERKTFFNSRRQFGKVKRHLLLFLTTTSL